MNIEMERIRVMASLVLLGALLTVATSATAFPEASGTDCDLFNTDEILDESTFWILGSDHD